MASNGTDAPVSKPIHEPSISELETEAVRLLISRTDMYKKDDWEATVKSFSIQPTAPTTTTTTTVSKEK